jgi:hypothetical protein
VHGARKTKISVPSIKDIKMATAEENMVIVRRILGGIDNNNLHEVMSELGFEVTKSTDKSAEWSLKEPE